MRTGTNPAEDQANGPSPDVEYSLDLHPDAGAAREARHGVRAALDRWRLPQVIDVCQLAVSELVTNAVIHGRAPVRLLLRRRSRELRLDVEDASPEGPSRSLRRGDVAEGGRGWDIVQAISDDSGVERIPHDGKRVFASWRLNSLSHRRT